MEEPQYQHETLDRQAPADAAVDLVAAARLIAEKAEERLLATGTFQPGNTALQIQTALEELRKVQEHASWSIRMLVELTGRARNDDMSSEGLKRQLYPSQRTMERASGAALASIHSWIHHPAPLRGDGTYGPGTIPRPGQASHRFSPGLGDTSREDYEDD